MVRPASERPTELELQILKILWVRPAAPVRVVRQALAEQGRDLAHTSVITTLNTMVAKKYLKRSMDGNACLFSAKLTRDQVSRRMLGDVVQRVFDGSAKAVMLSLFEQGELNQSDLRELRELINRKVDDA